MVMTDPLGDMLTRIRNAQMRGSKKVVAPASKLAEKVLTVLEKEGFIGAFSRVDYGSGRAEFDILLKYHDGMPVIRELKRISKPGRRVYSSIKGLPMVRNGLGVSILSTPKGVMSDSEARSENVGGEVLCNIF